MESSDIRIIQKSEIDQSVNVVKNSMLETRYVERDDGDTAIIYLSSQYGCDRACRMCHLTQTGQTDQTTATLEEFVDQAVSSFRQGMLRRMESGKGAPKVIHYNFMARGEPMLNPVIMKEWDALSEALRLVASEYFPGVPVKYKISTIGTDIYVRDKDGYYIDGLTDMPFKTNLPEIYYSIYSTNKVFRKRFLPKAEGVSDVLNILSRYIGRGGEVRGHGAFIMLHNDDMNDIRDMVSMLLSIGIKKFNIVRFNTPDPARLREPDEDALQGIKRFMEQRGMEVQLVDRVGTDVQASCGTFFNPGNE